jgi:hypothetical protein
MPAARRHRSRPTHIRALEVIGNSGHAGCTEALMMAHGFTVGLLAVLLREGLVAATTEHMVAGGRKMEVAVLRLTEAGRRALAGSTGARG